MSATETTTPGFKPKKSVALSGTAAGNTALCTVGRTGNDLHYRGLENDVLVMALGEFGRTPRINAGVGRDHWPQAMSVLFAGGGLEMGQTIGETNRLAEYPISNPQSPGCVLSTMYQTLGIDYSHVFYDQAKRPLAILAEGKPIRELVG